MTGSGPLQFFQSLEVCVRKISSRWRILAAALIAPAVSLAAENAQWMLPEVHAPRVQRLVFASAAAKTNVSCFVWTPEVYDAEKDRRFPVLYWLHGTGGGIAGVPKLASHFDDAIRAGKIPPMLVVFPNGLAASMWCDSKDGRVPMETIVTKELVPEIDAKFRSVASREGRIIEGFSMGGYGAARLGFNHPDLFGAISILAGGPLDLEFKGPRATAKPQERDEILRDVFGGDMDFFRAQSPLVLAEQNAGALRGKSRIRMACGAKDFTLSLNRDLSAKLTKLGVEHSFTELPGVDHKPMDLLAGLGEANWDFYRTAFGAPTAPSANSAATELRMLFSTSQDVANVWGQLRCGVTPLHLVTNCANPGFELSCCLPRSDGAWDVYGQEFKQVSEHNDQVRGTSVWSVVHATTRDGVKSENATPVFTSEPGPWTFHHAMAYNPDAHEFLLLKLKMDNFGFQYTAFFSPDGRTWKQHPRAPLFYDGDAISLFWSTALDRFVLVSKSLHPFPKRFRDHGGATPSLNNENLRDRRVLAFRTSPDGRTWEPSDSMADVWNRGGQKKPRPDNVLTLPDADDPPDLEFYSGNGFWYHDRCYLLVLNYAASPLALRKHGPQLDTEWWVGHDGLRWERPGRGVNATGAEVTRLTHNPLLIGDQLLLHYGNRLLGMKRDRISFVSARANAEFSTRPFTMPTADLVLNAAIPTPDRVFVASSAYVMADVLDERGQVIPGFEAEKCVLQEADAINLPLRWGGKSARELAGKKISLRFHLRSANIYAVTSQ